VRAGVEAGAGLAVFGVGLAVLVRDVPAWNTAWFLFAWIGWLLVVDAAIDRLTGAGFLYARPRELGAMLFWSVPYWCLFEAYNLVLENWYYVFLPHSEVAQGLFASAAFATVLPACFFHAELLRAFGAFERTRWRPLRVTPGVEAGVVAFGIAAAVLPLVGPRTWFWIVWAATFGVPEVINRRLGFPSLLADLEAGRPGRLLRLLGGGLVAGLAWESMNYWARAKWIYVVPGFEDNKLFEMPFLGFLGFPALAVEAFSAYALLCGLVRGGRHWELPDRLQRGRTHPGRVFALVLGFSAATSLLTLDPAVQARRPLLEALEGLSDEDLGRLRAAGVPSPEWLCRRVEAEGAAALAGRSGVDEERIVAAYRHADLALHKGMGTDAASRLLEVGIGDVAALGRADADGLAGALAGADGVRAAQVRVWVRAAAVGGDRRR
jgi:hypothetical protein